MKTSIFIFAVFLFMGSVVARPHNHAHREKRAFVTDVTTVEVPEVINWVDSTGSTVTIETKGHVNTHKPAQRTSNYDIGTTFSSHDTPTTVAPTVTDIPPSASTLVSEPSSTAELKTTGVKPKPIGTNPTEVKPTEVKPSESKPAESKTTAVETLVSTKPPTTPETTHLIPTSTPLPPNGPPEKWFSGTGFGICYAPYTADGKCKTQDQVYADFAKLQDYGIVRSYGVDCNQISMMINAAKRYDKKVMLGLFTIQNVDSDLHLFIAAAKDSWSYIYAVAIGNEVVNTGKSSAHDLTNAINFSRTTLRSQGYSGPVVAVDTVNAMVAHPDICETSDFCAVNIHPFFNSRTSAAEAGKFVIDQAKTVSNAVHGSKRVIVTETGWPHGGDHNGEAIPSREDQYVAIESMKQAFKGTNGELFLFSAFDDPWKKDGPNTFGAEKFWGIQ
ncbi:Cell surface mannoprotein mp65 [Microsporum audouinii]